MTCRTQMFFARQGTITPEMQRVAEPESLPVDAIREAIIAASPVPIGTVPIYQAIEIAGDVTKLTADDILDNIEHQAQQGVDYVTVHTGILREHVGLALGRVTGIVSRGGSLMAYWMTQHGKQNPLYEHHDPPLDSAAGREGTT